jgi:two-component system, OmpR family, phosphate regulon sensor histidine kinase PhoR
MVDTFFIMKNVPWFLSPVLIFIGSLVAVIISLILFIYWSLRVKFGVENFVQKFKLSSDPLLELNTWVTIFTLSILVVVIIFGISIIYVYYQKSINLYRLQNNFINNFTHELKTPLTSINLFLDTLKNHEINRGDQIKYIDFMRDDASRLGGIINHILSTAKIESNSYSLKRELINLPDLVRDIINNNPRFVKNIDIEIKSKCDFHFHGDKELFEMLVINIITNAIKYNESSSPTLTISMARQAKLFIIEFIDNGIGIDSDQQSKIFKKFYQVGDSLDVSAKGSGLGLFLSQTVANMHKCKLSVSSEGLGEGSSFFLKCPISQEVRSKQ